MRKTNAIMTVFVGILIAAALFWGGTPSLYAGLRAGAHMFRDALWLLLAAFALSGLVKVLTDPEKVSRLLGKESGLRGMFLGAVAGGVIPGGPYVYYPVASSFHAAGADIRTVMAFIVAKCLWDVSRLPMEAAIIGGRVAAVRFAVTALFPLLAGAGAHVLYPRLAGKKQKAGREVESVEIHGA